MSQSEQRYEKLFTVRQVARILQVDDTTIRKWIKNGEIEAILLPGGRLKKRYRIRKSTVDAILNQGRERE
jgi:excisionase family DNA binding protein